MDAMGWIGAALPRREDRRHLLGQGVFAADIPAHDALHLAFLRSPVAHGRLSGLRRPPGGWVFTAEDLGPLPLLPAGPDMPGFRQAPYPPLADGHVRFVGQPIAACAAPTLAAAEDLLAACEALIDPLPALPDVAAALAPGARPLHAGWTDNRYATGRVRGGDLP
ncbi:MAG: xanthine dehydrogenase family protein molybdopterin-binding subunit, partial [Acetobacteraceae bacterium]